MADNRYSKFKYGTTHKYGASSLPIVSGAIAWGIEIDWNDDTVFDHGNESDRLLKTPVIRRGRKNMLRPAGQGFETIQTGSCTFTLSNHDGKFDAWNTSSPLYPNVDSGKEVRIRVRDLTTGTIYNRFYGFIQDIDPVGYGADAIVIIRAEDGMRLLRDTYATVKRPYPDGTFAPASIKSIMESMLTTIQWQSRWGSSVAGSQYGIRVWYANGDRSIGAEFEDLGLSYFGYVYISTSGQFVFVDKFSSQTPVLSVSQSQLLKDIGNPQPWSIKRNVVKLRFHVRSRSDNVVIWQPQADDAGIGPGETRSYIVDYTNNGYEAFAEGLETLVSFVRVQGIPQPSVVFNASYSVTDYGVKAFVSFTNNEAFTLYLYPGDPITIPTTGDATYLRGDITWTERTKSISNPRNPVSSSNQRALVLDSLWYQNEDQSFEFVDKYQAFISVGHKTPIIKIENRFDLQFVPDLFNVITVDIPALGINSEDFRIGCIEEQEGEGGGTQSVLTTFYLEPFLPQTTGAGAWGSAIWGTSKWSW